MPRKFLDSFASLGNPRSLLLGCMMLRRNFLTFIIALLGLAMLPSPGVPSAGGAQMQATVSMLLIAPAHAAPAASPRGTEDLDELERFIAQNPGVILAAIALPIILLLTILARPRHYFLFSILTGAIAGAACQTIPIIATFAGSPILARLLQSVVAALAALMCALLFIAMFFLARLSRRLVLGHSLRGPDPLRGWFREAIVVPRWVPGRDRAQEVDDAVVRWHAALVTGAGAMVAAVVIQGHFVHGLQEHFSTAGFLTTSVILIAALYILEPVRERILRLADPAHHEEGPRDSLIRMVITSPRQGGLVAALIVIAATSVQVLIIGLEEAIQKATPFQLLELAFGGLGPMPIAYFLCGALQTRMDLDRATRGTSVFVALLVFAFLLMIAAAMAAFAGVMAADFFQPLLDSAFARFTIVPLIGLVAGLVAFAILFWLGLGIALVVGFVFNGLSIWVLKIVWPRTRGASALAYLAFAIVIVMIAETLLIAPLQMLGAESPGDMVRALVIEPLAAAVGWLVGLWLSGIAGVLAMYQQARPELFPNLKIPEPH